MKQLSDKNGGMLLLIFFALIFFTMVLHPVGGDFEHLLKLVKLIITTHAIAIASLPFAGIGFWCLTRRISNQHPWSVIAFAFLLLALLGALMAATANGLVLPVFILKYSEADPVTIESLKPFLKYNRSVNIAFDYMYTGSLCVAIGCWLVAIWKTRTLPRWTAILGLAVLVLALLQSFSGFVFTTLIGLRVFLTAVIAWIISVAYCLITINPVAHDA